MLWQENIRTFCENHLHSFEYRARKKKCTMFALHFRWSDADFMLHGWKTQEVGHEGWESPFRKNLDPSLCGPNLTGWDWIPNKHVNASAIRYIPPSFFQRQLMKALATFRIELARFERYSWSTYPAVAQKLMYVSMPDIGECYPDCENET